MKKVIFLTAVALIALSSCKKNRTCACTGVESGNVDRINLVNISKKDAKNICTAKSNSYQICELE